MPFQSSYTVQSMTEFLLGTFIKEHPDATKEQVDDARKKFEKMATDLIPIMERYKMPEIDRAAEVRRETAAYLNGKSLGSSK